jgi:serine protease Do
MAHYRKSTSILMVLLLATALVVSGCTLASAPGSEAVASAQSSQPNAATPAVVPTALPALPADLLPDESLLASLYQRVNPSVVNIRVVKQGTGLEGMQNLPQMPNQPGPGQPPGGPQMPNPYPQQGEGSGFVWDSEGHIVTNNHVVEGAQSIEVTFADDTRLDASLVGSDPHSDLAVLKIDPAGLALRPVELGDSDALYVGQFAIAIGNPFGQVGTMTRGIISALGRAFRASTSQFSITEMIQTDAAINPGNSGGPLLDSKGRVVGINTLILSQSGSSAGVGFSIPINTAKKVVPSLINTGKYDYAYLGVVGTDLMPSIDRAMNLPTRTRGALLTEVSPGAPAAAAGLRGGSQQIEVNGMPANVGGDVIIAVDGKPVNKMADMLDFLAKQSVPGQTIVLTILRDGQQMNVSVTLGTRPASATP